MTDDRSRAQVRQDFPKAPWARVPVWLFDAGATKSAVWIYAAMVGIWADADRRAWPTLETVAKTLGVSERTVSRALADLRKVGGVTATPRVNTAGRITSTLYEFHIEAPDKSVRPSVTSDRRQGDRNDRQNQNQHEPEAPKGDGAVTSGQLLDAQEPPVQAIVWQTYGVWGWVRPRASLAKQREDVEAALVIAAMDVGPDVLKLTAENYARDPWNRKVGFSIKRMVDSWEKYEPPVRPEDGLAPPIDPGEWDGVGGEPPF